MAPGLFAFVPLDNAAIFWRHSSEEFHNADAALTMFEEQRVKRRRGDRYAEISI